MVLVYCWPTCGRCGDSLHIPDGAPWTLAEAKGAPLMASFATLQRRSILYIFAPHCELLHFDLATPVRAC